MISITLKEYSDVSLNEYVVSVKCRMQSVYVYAVLNRWNYAAYAQI
jgi:hypothetical protein